MNILWLCAMRLPIVSDYLGLPSVNQGGWLDGLSRSFVNTKNQLTVLYPSDNPAELGNINNIGYHSYSQNRRKKLYSYDIKWDSEFEIILKEYKPDIVHIWGCEFPASLALAKVIEGRIPYVVSIHGIPDIIANHYFDGLPMTVRYGFTLRDFVKADNIALQRKKYLQRGQYAKTLLQMTSHILGRTDYDHAYSTIVNREATYHHANESLRKSFYNNVWTIDSCERHSIFCSQVHYPIKGLHYLLPALAEIIKVYPDCKLYIAGSDISRLDYKHETSYSRYICRMIKKLKLSKHVIFLGQLSEQKMCSQYLKSHVFISCSLTENESNSISEAKALGVPIVASYVGGVTERIEHYKSGFYYQHNEPCMIAYYVCKLFADDQLALLFSKNGRAEAQHFFNQETNYCDYLSVYTDVINAEGQH